MFSVLLWFAILFLASFAAVGQKSIANSTVHGAMIEDIESERLLIRLREGLRTVALNASAPIHVESGPYVSDLPADDWSIAAGEVTPARFRHRVIVKGLNPPEFEEVAEHIDRWTAAGYSPETLMLGHRLRLESGGTIDARVLWISLAAFDTDAEAEALRKELETEGTWAWQRAELVAPGSGKGVLSSKKLGKAYELTFPATFTSKAPMTLVQQDAYEALSYIGELLFAVGGSTRRTRPCCLPCRRRDRPDR